MQKKTNVKCNGTYDLQVQTRHGQFTVANQKFHCPEKGSSAFLQTYKDCQSAVTQGLEALAMKTCLNTPSFEKAREMLVEVVGCGLMTRQTLCNWVQKTALRIDTFLIQDGEAALQSPLPPLADAIDLYDPAVTELHLFEDGILVKAQKPTHEEQGIAKIAKTCQFHQSNFSLAPRPDGSYAFVFGSSDGTLSLSTALQAFFSQHWQDAPAPLRLVAITDGAKDLRKDLWAAFGSQLVIILDWYHLRKKVCEICLMLVSTKQARTDLKKQLLHLLFAGQVAEALEVLSFLPIRNAFMHDKLVSYLTKHTSEIIDYARRAHAKKTIGSGRMEKGVDQVIGIRQKDKGMSWSKSGSYALGMITAFHANGHWDQLWDTLDKVA